MIMFFKINVKALRRLKINLNKPFQAVKRSQNKLHIKPRLKFGVNTREKQHNMKFKRLLLLLIVLSGVCVKSYAQSAIEQDILKYTNEFRKTKGKAPLTLAQDISAQAEKHSKNMSSGATPMGHEGFRERVKALESPGSFISGAAENVAYGNMTAKEVVAGWIKSPTHKKNLLGHYTDIGIGVAKGKDGYLYFTQVFINR